jgi:hypothetical protein
MNAKLTLFPVGNGDMTLIELADGETQVLVDVNIRALAEDDEESLDAAAALRKKVKRDGKGRPYLAAFLLSHPDQDHCSGLIEHFWLGSPSDYPDDKKKDAEKRILIREIWSSPIVFRRASKNHILCDDARAFADEARRRVKVNREKKFNGVSEGDRILILGEDEDGKTDDLGPILVKVDQEFDRINWSHSKVFRARLLAPLPKDGDETEELLSKNHSSTILNIRLASDEKHLDACRFLTAGDAEVAIWELLWAKHKRQAEVLEYDILLTPHHCSWHSLSYDSWSENHEDAEVSAAARSALSQARPGATLVASSDAIKDDDNDPPCYGAKREYEKIARSAQGSFVCTGEYPTESAPAPLEFLIGSEGISLGAAARREVVSRSLRPAAVASGLTFPNRQVVPNKPAGFA